MKDTEVLLLILRRVKYTWTTDVFSTGIAAPISVNFWKW